MNIAIFYHCLFLLGDPPQPVESSVEVVSEQMNALIQTGLLNEAKQFIVGINGGKESLVYASILIPNPTRLVLHGLDSRNECSTIRLIEDWVKIHPEWAVFYFHSKGATHAFKDSLRQPWRDCMMRHLALNWRQCVKDLENGFDSVGCHWMTYPQAPKGQSIWAGTFFWANSTFLATLPSLMQRDRIKTSGLKSLESRYEAEVWIGNGPRLPKVKDYHPHWNPGKVATCAA